MRTLAEIQWDNPEEARTTHERWFAAKLYVAGKITLEEFEAYEPSYQTDYVAAMMALARKQIAQENPKP